MSVLARAHQDAVRERGRLVRRLRSQLREYYPAALEAFKDLSIRTAVTILSAAPTPALAAQLSHDDILQLARSCGRWGISHREVTRLHTVLHRDQLRQPAVVEDAMGSAVTAILLNLRITTATVARLEAELAKHLDQHDDAPILRSLPGVASVLAGRMLGEFGDDPDRFADAARRRDYAGTAPITKASGKSRVVLMRRTRNTRLSGACRDWAFTASNQSPGAHAYYLHRRLAGDGHEAALRRLGNKLVGQLHHCLEHREPYRRRSPGPTPSPLNPRPARNSRPITGRNGRVKGCAKRRHAASRSALDATAETRTLPRLPDRPSGRGTTRLPPLSPHERGVS